MFRKLRRAFQGADASVDTLLADPLVQLRIALSAARGDGVAFGVQEINGFIGQLLAVTPAVRQEAVEDELELVKQAVLTGAAPAEFNLSSPETQLLWAAALILIQKNPALAEQSWLPQNRAKTLTETPLWQGMIATPRATEELLQHAFYVTEALRNPTARIRWGPPGSWFYFSPDENIINVDFLLSLIGGMEHTRSILFHEIGHSQLTVKFPDRMVALRQEIDDLKEAAKGRKMTEEEYMKLRLVSAEWHLRMQLFDKTENDCVNRYTANMGRQLAQDYGYSLNHVTTTLSGFGAQVMRHDKGAKPPEGVPETDRRWGALMTAINLVFFKNNAYFPHTRTGWRRLGVDTDYISSAPKISANDNDVFPSADFARLVELCGGKEGLEHLQPAPRDRLYGRAWYNRLTDEFADRRNAIAEQIWNLYIEPFLPDLMKEIEKVIKEEMEQKKQEQKGQPGQDGQEGDPQQGQGEGQGQDGDGQGQSGQKGQKGQKGKKGGQKGGESEKGDSDDAPESGEGEGGEETDKDADGQGKGEPGQVAREAAKSGAGEGKVDVDGVGDMPDVETPSDSPGEKPGQDNGKDAKNGKDSGQGDPGKTLDELMEEARKQQEKNKGKDKGKGQGEKSEGESDDSDSRDPGKGAGSGGKPVTLEQLNNVGTIPYSKIVESFMPFISLIARMMQKIRERQVEKVSKVSRSLEPLPQGNEIRRLDRNAHRNLIIKQKTGQELGDSDLNRFRKNVQVEQPTTLDIVLMIDGSGSMDSKVGLTKVSALEIAMASAIAIHEAAKRIDANVYICMWGNSDPLILAQPGDDHATISENISKAMKGLNSGTDLAPAVKKMVRTISENREKGNAQSGYTHFMVLSDGDINDDKNAQDMITKLFRASKYVTMDFAVIKTGTSNQHYVNGKWESITAMEKLAQTLQTALPHQNIGVVTGNGPEKLPLAIVGMLLDKMRSCGSFRAVPTHLKRGTIRRALTSMEIK